MLCHVKGSPLPGPSPSPIPAPSCHLYQPHPGTHIDKSGGPGSKRSPYPTCIRRQSEPPFRAFPSLHLTVEPACTAPIKTVAVTTGAEIIEKHVAAQQGTGISGPAHRWALSFLCVQVRKWKHREARHLLRVPGARTPTWPA